MADVHEALHGILSQVDTYIPTSFYYNSVAQRTKNFERTYRQWFKSDMREALPRFAITGYDQAQFFLRGISTYGSAFKGTKQQTTYAPHADPAEVYARV